MLIPNSQALSNPSSPKLDLWLTERHHGDDDGDGGDMKQGDEAVESSSAVVDSSRSAEAIAPISAFVDAGTTSAPLTSTSAAPDTIVMGSGSAAPTLQFLNMQNATTCQSYTFSWVYTGPKPSPALTLLISEGSPRSRDNTTMKDSSYYKDNTITIRILSANIFSNTTSFTWDPVDLKEGWYTLGMHLTKPDRADKFSYWPTSFYVINGTDTGCVKFYKPIAGSRLHLGTGDVVAIIVGAVVAAGLLAVAFTFPRLWRRDLPSPKRPRPYYLY